MLEIEDEVIIKGSGNRGRVIDKAYYDYLDQYVYAIAEYETSYTRTYFEKDLTII